MKIEKKEPPKHRTMHRAKYDFEKLKPGDSFFVTGIKSPGTLAISFGLHLARGRYTIRREVVDGVVGYRFYLLK